MWNICEICSIAFGGSDLRVCDFCGGYICLKCDAKLDEMERGLNTIKYLPEDK
jgi:hypothetical protein